MVSFWDNVLGVGRAAYGAVDRTLFGGYLPGGDPSPANLQQAVQSYNNVSRGNYGPVNDSPWRPGGQWANRPVGGRGAQGATFTTPGGGMPGGGGSFGGGSFGGGSFNFTPPAFQMPEIKIPSYQPPKPPKVKKLTYGQLNALIKQDPGYLEALATEKRNYDEAMSEVNAARGRQELYQEEDARRLEQDSLAALRSVLGQTNAGNSGMGMSAIRARMRQEAAAQRAESDLEREYADIFAQLNSQGAQLGRQYESNRATAKQNAINRYLSTRVQPTEIVY